MAFQSYAKRGATATTYGGGASVVANNRRRQVVVSRASRDFKGFGDEPKPSRSNKEQRKQQQGVMTAEEIQSAMEEIERKNKAKAGPTGIPQIVESSTQRSAAAEQVSTRILQRILTFAGIPTFTGILLLPLFYFLKVTQGIEVPMWAVYLSQAFFVGGGLLGISYGALSASWDPMRQGSLLGFDEFQVNLPVIWAQYAEANESRSHARLRTNQCKLQSHAPSINCMLE
eukprot:CAMPEP_0184478680 /NCGR_PEP_ID=MMETSP0113_2-20130426/645_1 /TAXON_ID=91329 /ORGANISM="Norrisiella sphaerica, Strain BC52" /LENGTH=228 /DNA_ID=CAMNT_0026856563 /DNA_START=760 /DNA_END=1444 /DNA_ORIENTATION=+